MRTTSSSGTAPCMVQPKAVDTAPSISTPGCGYCAHLRTSSTIWSGVMRTLDSLCWRLAETGKVTFCAPASSARWKPLRFGASATTLRPGIVRAKATISAVSAIAGMSFGGTKEPTSISLRPALASARIHAFFAAVGIRCLAFCNPSRGPTSQIWTLGMRLILAPALLDPAKRDAASAAAERECQHRPEGRFPAAVARGDPGDGERPEELSEIGELQHHAVAGGDVLRRARAPAGRRRSTPE